MKWLTEEEIKEAAKKSKRAAIKMSIRHWEQLHSVTLREFFEAEKKDLASIGGDYCSLCRRYNWKPSILKSPRPCPLINTICGEEERCSWAWRDVSAIVNYADGLEYITGIEEMAWRYATLMMLQELRKLL